MHPHEPSRLSLANLPTPLAEMKNLARDLGIERFYIKRDDETGLEASGNKVRKLEYIVADALKQGATTLVTLGGFQSNHCRATAAIGARLGLKVRLLLRSADPNPANDGNLFLDRLFGADVSFHHPDEYNGKRAQLIEATMATERAEGRIPYFFPVGASMPLGCWGYIRCVAELVDQLGKDTNDRCFQRRQLGGNALRVNARKSALWAEELEDRRHSGERQHRIFYEGASRS